MVIWADTLAGENLLLFNTLESEAGARGQTRTRLAKLRDGWKTTVFKHGVARATHC